MGGQFRDEASSVEAEPTDAEDPGTPLNTLVEELALCKASEAEKHWFARWLGEQYPELVVEALLTAVGDHPLREGLRNTPGRVVRSWRELFAGYGQSAEDVFTPGSDQGFGCEDYDQMVTLRDIPFTSFCEHHILSFEGLAHVAYLPDKKLLGVSKLIRLVEIHARRLQNQERITNNVVDDLMKVSGAKGAGVVLVAAHQCMICRGVKKPGARMITTALRGVFQRAEVKQEFLAPLWNN